MSLRLKKIVGFVLENRLAIWLMTIICIVGGIYSSMTMKRETMPNMSIPYLVVSTMYPGAAPQQVANAVSNPIEKKINNLDGVKNVETSSYQNVSVVKIEYDYGLDMDKKKQELEKALDKLEMNTYVEEPNVVAISMDSMPVVTMSVGSDKYSREEISNLVKDDFAKKLEKVDGVESVSTSGLVEKQLSLKYNQTFLDRYKVSKEDVNNWIKQNNEDVSLGIYEFKKNNEAVAITQKPKSISKMLESSVPQRDKLGRNMKLKDFVTIHEVKSTDTISRLNGKPAISLSVTAAQTANTLNVVNDVKDTIKTFEKKYSHNVHVKITLDMGEPINESVNTMLSKALFGALFAILIILVFLRDTRSTLISVVSIPLSLLMAMFVLDKIGITLNVMTLGAMTIAIGRVIDDSIVVVENIYRRIHLNNGKLKGKELIKEATVEMFIPIMSSTLVTAVVFLPIGLVGGMIGEITLPFALSMILSLAASLVVAVTLVPVMAYQLFKKELRGEGKPKKAESTKLADIYKKSLTGVLNHKWISSISVIAILAISIALIGKVGFSFMDSEDTNALSGKYEPAVGETKSEQLHALKVAENYIMKDSKVSAVQSTYGSTGDMSALFGGSDSPTLQIIFKDDVDSDLITKRIDEYNKHLSSESLKGIWTIKVSTNGTNNDKVEYNIYGNNREDVANVTKRVEKALKANKNISDVSSTLSDQYVENRLVLDKDKISAMGLTGQQLGYMLMNYGKDEVVTQITNHGNEMDLVVKYEKKNYKSMKDLMNKSLFPGVKLKDVATIKKGKTYSEVNRSNGEEYTTVSGTLKGKSVSKVRESLNKSIDKIDKVNGVTIDEGGVSAQMMDSFKQMGLALLAAIAIVFLVLVLTFKEGLAPFAILFSLPLTIIGVIFGLLVAGEPLGMSSMLGLLMLVGIVVTNGIVLIDKVLHLEKSGESIREALIEAGGLRIRPILMTAIATVGALIPVALGVEGGGLIGKGLGVTVIGGLVSSTLLTLFVVPLVYEMLSKLFKKDRSKIEE